VLFGCNALQTIGSSVEDLCFGEPPDSRAEAVANLGRALRDGPQVFDWLSRRLDGSSVWCEVAVRRFEIDGDQRVIASVRDITERKRAALERERLMAEAQAANTAKDEFLAVLSHELRNPLAAIQASIGVIRNVLNGGEPRTSRAVEAIERNVRLQARLVNDLLDLSHLVRGKLQIQRAPLQLEEVALSAVQACRADADRAEVALETHLAAGVWVEADADRMQQVIINLVDNGIKFTPQGGRVTIKVEGHGRHGCIIVEDTGRGIERERLPEIFEMFRQGQIAARRAPGLGIGLALVKSITELHGGGVRAESDGPGRGSRFIVELPATEAPAKQAAGEALPERAAYKMLLLEDNEDTRTMLMETFLGLGYQVSGAASAEAALDLLRREAADVILADVGLPGMDGYEFLRHARHLPGAEHALALVLTGYGQPRDIQRAREAGYDDHFVKPADVTLIHQRIRSGLLAANADVKPVHSAPASRAE
jgi:PAS domain S-box-containing protein